MIDVWRQAARQPWNRTEFEALFLAHYQGIYRMLFRVVGRQEEAEELAQETFLRLYRQRFLPGREHNVRAWLYRVATNLAYNALRGQRRQEERQVRAMRQVWSREEAANPEEEALRREEQGAVRRTLAALPRPQSQLLLAYYAGLDYRELAEFMGVTPSSVGTLLARAKKAFEARYRADILAREEGGSNEV